MDPDEGCPVVEREATFIRSDGSGQPIMRKGWFLRPNENISFGDLGVPFFPEMQRPCSNWVSKLDSKVSFKGWPYPQSNWKEWVEKLRPTREAVWKKAGIFDAIQASTCKIRKYVASIWEVMLYWSPKTNTFIFPFGEASITLEDTMVLGGFSPEGVCARGVGPLNEELEEVRIQLLNVHRAFFKTKLKKPCFSAWTNLFMKRNGDLIEHVAFLSLWLSKFVNPKAPGEVIKKELFPIAILLAQGERFALGPAVLASIYRDMRLLKEYLTSGDKDDALPIFAPFSIVQMWILEHFVAARQNACPKFIGEDKPWAMRWNDLSIKRISHARLVCEPHNFIWRPYPEKFNKWSSLSGYTDNGHRIYGNNLNDEMATLLARCLRSCVLVGLDSMEVYLPQRVSRHFGYDQELFGCAHVDSKISDWELAWANYTKHELNYVLYICPQHHEPDVTYQYYLWWKEKISCLSSFEVDDIGLLEKSKRKKLSIEPGRQGQKLEVDSSMTPLNIELTGLARVNVRILKGVARMMGASSSDTSTEDYQGTNEEANLGAAGGKRHDGLHELEYTENEALDYGTSRNDSQGW